MKRREGTSTSDRAVRHQLVANVREFFEAGRTKVTRWPPFRIGTIGTDTPHSLSKCTRGNTFSEEMGLRISPTGYWLRIGRSPPQSTVIMCKHLNILFARS
jgi:hypothetical protein